MINLDDVIDYLFQQVEQNNIEEVKKIFEHYPNLKKDPKKLRAQNGWNPDLFAARFGYTDMLMYFLEEIYQGPKRRISDLVLLNIHSGSLKTMYYLHKKENYKFKDEDMIHFYQNSFKLEKKSLCLYFLLRDLFVIDKKDNQTTYYNIYPVKQNDNSIVYYKQSKFGLEGDQIIQSDLITKIENRDQQIFNFLKMKSNIFNYNMLQNLQNENVEERQNSKHKWGQVFEAIRNSEQIKKNILNYLKQIVIMLNDQEIKFLIQKSSQKFLKVFEIDQLFNTFQKNSIKFSNLLNIENEKDQIVVFLNKQQLNKKLFKNNFIKKRQKNVYLKSGCVLKIYYIHYNTNICQKIVERIYVHSNFKFLEFRHILFSFNKHQKINKIRLSLFKEQNYNKILNISPKIIMTNKKTKLYLILKNSLKNIKQNQLQIQFDNQNLRAKIINEFVVETEVFSTKSFIIPLKLMLDNKQYTKGTIYLEFKNQDILYEKLESSDEELAENLTKCLTDNQSTKILQDDYIDDILNKITEQKKNYKLHSDFYDEKVQKKINMIQIFVKNWINKKKLKGQINNYQNLT